MIWETIAFVCFVLAIGMMKFKIDLSKMNINNAWETKSGDVVVITELGDVNDAFILKCVMNNEEYRYNTAGERAFDFNDDNKLVKYLGNNKTHPEYFL